MTKVNSKQQFTLFLLLTTTIILAFLVAGFSNPKELKKTLAAHDFRQAVKMTFVDYQTGTAIKVPGGNGDVLIDGSFTIEAWVKPTKAAGGNYNPPMIMCKAFTNEGLPIPFCLQLGVYYGQFRPYFTVDANSVQYQMSATKYLSTDKWYHLAATVDAEDGIMRLFINGEMSGEKNLGRNMVFDDPDRGFTIGAVGYTGWEDEINSYGYSFDGLIDEVRVSEGIRYESDFSPQMKPFHPDGMTMALYNFDNNFKDRSGGSSESTGEGIGDIEFVVSDIPSSN